MRNIARINNYYNRIEALRDWRSMADRAIAAGRADLVEMHAPAANAGWRTIDKAIAALRAAMADEEVQSE